MPIVAVFDTNILLSALFTTNGNPFRCLAAAKIGQIESITCQTILDEFVEKLLVKFKFSEAMAQSAASEIRSFSKMIAISGNLKAVADDPDDDMVVECALLGKATHIVTGDKHLLKLKRYRDIEIVRAATFVELLASL
jgi:putative PIN family toxin of toxin-antitoxin system